MSLDFDWSRVADDSVVLDEDSNIRPLAKALIWGHMAVGLNGIQEENLEEWAFRCAFLHRVGGELYYCDGKPQRITIKELRPFVGLTTNVPTVPRAKWIGQCMRNFREEAIRDADAAVREQLG